jgi:cardiolipin synthase
MARCRENAPSRYEDTVMTIPNIITLARIALVPGFLISVIYGQLQISLGLFILAATTDVLDGLLARFLHQETQLGLYLDPLADKLLCTASYLSLAFIGLLPAWLTVVVFFKDFYIGMGVAIVYFFGRTPRIRPTSWGKGATFVQSITIGTVLLGAVLELDLSMLDALFWFTGGMTVVSGGHYIVKGLDQLKEGDTRNTAAPV